MKKASMISMVFCIITGIVVWNLIKNYINMEVSVPEIFTLQNGFEMSKKHKPQLEDEAERALQTYREFLTGTINAGMYNINTIIIPTGEPYSRYYTEYAFFDSSGDGTPELHVRSARNYFIFTYKDDQIVFWSSLSPYAKPLNNRAFLSTRFSFASTTESHGYTILDYSGNKVLQIGFSFSDSNQNGIYDEGDEYWFCEAQVSKETYDILTNPYMTISSDLIKWVVLCESKS